MSVPLRSTFLAFPVARIGRRVGPDAGPRAFRRRLLGRLAAFVMTATGLAAAPRLRAQGPPAEHPARRVANIVGVAVDEYAKAFDARDRLVAPAEYQEAVDFLADARGVAAGFSGARGDAARGRDPSISGVPVAGGAGGRDA